MCERIRTAVISGSGPAGAGLALALAAREPKLAEEILVLEAGRHPREKICAGGITANGIRRLRGWGAAPTSPRSGWKGSGSAPAVA
jgi:2-polyprenyl-6-methoxyphenol hydroxylase-like FAD-dependent oxidoreductase